MNDMKKEKCRVIEIAKSRRTRMRSSKRCRVDFSCRALDFSSIGQECGIFGSDDLDGSVFCTWYFGTFLPCDYIVTTSDLALGVLQRFRSRFVHVYKWKDTLRPA